MAGEINKMQSRPKDTKNWIGPAIGAVGGIASSIIGQGAQKKAERRQLENSKEMAKFNQKQALEMWEKTNYSAQIAQMKKAGLNVGLMYGQAGEGGTANATTASAGMQQDQTGQRMSEGIGMALNARMQEAQIKLAEAAANKTNVEAKKIGGEDTELAKAQIEALTQGLNNKKAEQALTEIHARLATENIELIKAQTKNMLIELGVNEATAEDRAEMVKIQKAGMEIANALQEAQTKATYKGMQLDDAKIQEIGQTIAQKWQAIAQGWSDVQTKKGELSVKQFEAILKKEMPNLMSVGGSIVQDVLQQYYNTWSGWFGTKKPKRFN